MIQAKELRIGNIINYAGKHTKVLSISLGKECSYVSTSSSGAMPIGCYHPIPLTEDILLKCGFENEIDEIDGKFYNIYFVTNTDYLIEYFHKDKKYIFTDDMGLKVYIKHLHQLQNLYHALTGQELKIKI